ncbi:primosomal protein N' family DNA-binding protein [Actinomarinicola tropica]|uniref:Primosomal protein N' 3' DNA-binding domain-containing protein n=1 Tax=Actinomarinicola tropica TaxID=2789776 RepID=A0A5Q2RE95_9ACTN|nr:hypothetical protein [Actinomarinicola tropica]QGG95189.1 hypothetical protein GH723_08800 [Actinomarinicola tropica]
MLPDEPAIDREFDYLVPSGMEDLALGDVVRVGLHGRRVGGWVVEDDVAPAPGLALSPVAKRSGVGPSGDLIDLAGWAAWRWAGRRASLLRTATPPHVVPSLPAAPTRATPVPAVRDEQVEQAFSHPVSVLRLPPTADRFPVALAAVARGQALLLVPSVGQARSLAVRLRRSGVEVAVHPRDWAGGAAGQTIVGARAAAWARAAELAAVVVFDEHDEVWQEERTPTWHAREVAIERARRAGVPCVLVSPIPSLEALDVGTLVAPSRRVERAGWPLLDVIDRRGDDPVKGGLWSERLVPVLRGEGRVVCVLNRKGRARLLACVRCGELARCEACGASMEQVEAGVLRCRACGTERPQVCQACGGLAQKNLRVGVTRAREELEALVGEPVVEVTGAAEGPIAEARVYVGTEAVLHQIPVADRVVFLDLDQELLAPRYRAAEQALSLLTRAARVVGRRGEGGRVVVQTRLPDHPVVQAVLRADPTLHERSERARRQELRQPPFTAMAEVSGAAAPELVQRLGTPPGVEVLGPSDGRWLLRAGDHRTLCDALAAVPRPQGRVRVAVDPLRV